MLQIGGTCDAAAKNIFDAYASKVSAFNLSCDAALTVLRVDQIIMSKQACWVCTWAASLLLLLLLLLRPALSPAVCPGVSLCFAANVSCSPWCGKRAGGRPETPRGRPP
jgi:hypothetical protein